MNTWESGTYLSENIYRKIETDWKMAYLARTEESDLAKIVWKFNFDESFLVIKSIKLRFDAKVFENGNIKLLINDEFGEYFFFIQILLDFWVWACRGLTSSRIETKKSHRRGTS